VNYGSSLLAYIAVSVQSDLPSARVEAALGSEVDYIPAVHCR